jgi:hypothetical protein
VSVFYACNLLPLDFEAKLNHSTDFLCTKLLAWEIITVIEVVRRRINLLSHPHSLVYPY